LFSSVTFESVVIPLPWDWVSQLEEDGIFVGEGDRAFPKFAQEINSSDDEKWQGDDGGSDDRQIQNMGQLKTNITAAIEKLGCVFPKLNWSAPQDATWMIPDGTLCCHNADQVLLVLKSSDIISQDLEQFERPQDEIEVADLPSPFFLVLKKYVDISISSEFRCFVKNNCLIGISQRYPTNFYPFLLKEKPSLSKIIVHFFKQNIQSKFPEADYVFDVYVNPLSKQNSLASVYLVDFAVFGTVTEPCLFSWSELFSVSLSGDEEVQFRVVENEMGVQPNTAILSRLPYELQYFPEGAMQQFLENLQNNKLEK